MAAYAEVEQIKDYLGITTTNDDPLLRFMLDDATRAIDDHTHRQFYAASDTTRYIDALGPHIQGNTLHIEDFGDICSITTVTNGDGVVISASERTLYPKTLTQDNPVYQQIKILSSSGKYWNYSTDWENAIAIVGKWVYSTTPPAAIKRACIRLVSFWYRQKDSQVFDVTAVEQGVVVKPFGIPPDVALMLKPYVRY